MTRKQHSFFSIKILLILISLLLVGCNQSGEKEILENSDDSEEVTFSQECLNKAKSMEADCEGLDLNNISIYDSYMCGWYFTSEKDFLYRCGHPERDYLTLMEDSKYKTKFDNLCKTLKLKDLSSLDIDMCCNVNYYLNYCDGGEEE